MTPIEEAFTDLAHAEKKDPAWVIRDTLPVGLTFLAGPPKVSHKSTISLVLACLAARWTCNCLPPWMSCLLGGPTMAFSYEADAGEVRSIIEDGLNVSVARGAIWIASDPWKFQLDVGEGPAELVRFLEIKMPRIVIMDPFRNMWSGDENDSGAIIKVLGPMQRWLKANEAAGIVVHHVNKPPKEGSDAWSPGNMFTMRGSSAIPGLADGILVVEPTKNEGVVTLHTRFKRGAAWKRTIQLGVPGYGWPSQGFEHIPDLGLAVQESWNNWRGGERSLDWLATEAANRKCQVRTVQDMLAMLDRNALVKFTEDERRILLPRVV